MTQSSPPPARAGGFLIAAGFLIGALAGIVLGQPSIGFLAGGAAGILGALALWIADRKR